MERVDITGNRYGRLIVTSFSHKLNERRNNRQTFWNCLCDCGNEVKVNGISLKFGRTLSCGCLRKEVSAGLNLSHGLTSSPEFYTFSTMKHRCNNPKNKIYHNYGGRGIKCLFESFQDFYDHVGPRPSGHHSIERLDNNGHYEKGNVVWATRSEQSVNKRNTVFINYKDQTSPLATLAHDHGIKPNIVWSRIYVYGWSVERSLTEPVKSRGQNKSKSSA